MIPNKTIIKKTEEALNKLSSKDFDNIDPWKVLNAFNEGMTLWIRRNLVGTNLLKIGDEASKRRIDDLQILLTTLPLTVSKKDGYFLTQLLPKNYLEWKRISFKGSSKCCSNKMPMLGYLAEEANVDELLRDFNKRPSFEWGETFVTIAGNQVKIYTNDEFAVEDVNLIYYRQPRRIEMVGIDNVYGNGPSTTEVTCEFKDDIVELFILEAVKILAGHIESFNVNQIADNSVETNN